VNIRSDYKSIGVLVAPFAFVVLGFASSQPTTPTPLVPALQSEWLLIHVPIIILSYCAFFVAFVASALYLLKDKQLSEMHRTESANQGSSADSQNVLLPASSEKADFLARFSLNQLDDLAYKSVAIGFPLLTIGIITGAIWAQTAWGSYWSWDPKETWSLITWFVFLIYLHAKTQNWSASLAAYIATFGFLSAICTFLGVDYVLPFLQTYLTVSAGMHGYAGGGATGGTILFCGILGAVILLLLVTRKKPPSASPAPPADATGEKTLAR
jgi:cytochrome c-type biogenesis protein CcsB